jgi:D-amino-acid dehydrogenase
MLNPESPFYIKPRLSWDLVTWLWRFRAACTEEHVARASVVLRDVSLKSIELFDVLASKEELDFSYEKKGLMLLYATEEGLQAGRHEAETLRKVGIAATEVDQSSLGERMGGVRTNAVGGMYYANEAHLAPSNFVHALANRAQNMGVEVRTETEAQGFEIKGRKVVGVRTKAGVLEADEFVLAAGSWSPGVAKVLRLRLPIQAAKGYSVTYEKPANAPRVPLIMAEARVAATPMGDMLRFAGTLELAGMDLSINQRRVDAILRAVDRYLPGLRDGLRQTRVWAGLRPTTPDGLALLGRSKMYDNLTVAAGHAMIGISTGPASGLLVSQVVTGEKPFTDISMFDPQRFS